jgi:hypothetical protein
MNKATTLLIVAIILLLSSLGSAKSEYKVVSTTKNTTTITLALSYTGKDDYYVKSTSPIIKNLLFTFHTLAFNDFTFKITDPNNKRF